MKEFNLNNLDTSKFLAEIDKKFKIKADNLKEGIYLYSKKLIQKRHNSEYDVIMEHEDKEITIIKPEKGKEKLAKAMEFGAENDKINKPPKPAWRLIDRAIKRESKKKQPGLGIMKQFKEKINPKGFGI